MLVGLLAGGIWRWKTRQPAAIVGLLLTGAALMALPVARAIPSEVLLGLALLGLAGLLTNVLSHSVVLQVGVAVPGAWLITGELAEVYSGWIVWLLFGAMAVGGTLVASGDQRLRSPILGPGLFAISLAGVFLDVPDTEEMLVLLGVMAPLVLLGWPLGLSRLGGAGSYMAVGTLIWAAAWGGIGRPGSVLGAIACLGVLLLVPLAYRGGEAISATSWPALVAVHLVVVGVASRVAGFRADAWEAAVIAVAALAAGLVATRALIRGDDDRHQRSYDPAGASSTGMGSR